jgi:hypothetical protein
MKFGLVGTQGAWMEEGKEGRMYSIKGNRDRKCTSFGE